MVDLAGLQLSLWDCLVYRPSLSSLGTWCWIFEEEFHLEKQSF